MSTLDPNVLLADPGPLVRGPARKWLAHELAAALAARVGLRERGPFSALVREHLLAAWSRRESPTLDDVLRAVVEPQPTARYGAAVDGLEMNTRLEIALRYMASTPEFGGRPSRGGQRAEVERFVVRASYARGCVRPVTQPEASSPDEQAAAP